MLALILLTAVSALPKPLCLSEKDFWAENAKKLGGKSLTELFHTDKLSFKTSHSTFYFAQLSEKPIFVQKMPFGTGESAAAAHKHVQLTFELQKSGVVPRLLGCFQASTFYALLQEQHIFGLEQVVMNLASLRLEQSLDVYIAVAEAVAVLHRHNIVLNLSDLTVIAFKDKDMSQVIFLDLHDSCTRRKLCVAKRTLFTDPQRLGQEPLAAQEEWDVFALGMIIMLSEMGGHPRSLQTNKLRDSSKVLTIPQKLIRLYQQDAPRHDRQLSEILERCLRFSKRLTLPGLLKGLARVQNRVLIIIYKKIFALNKEDLHEAWERKNGLIQMKVVEKMQPVNE